MSRMTETSTPMIVQVMTMSQLDVQNTPAPLGVQHTLVLLNLADWQVPNQVAPHRYMTTMGINAWARDLHGLVLTVKCCQVTGTSMVSERTVY